MARRKKSFNEIIAQQGRIAREIVARAKRDEDGFLNDDKSIARYKRVTDAAQRYMKNIMNTQSIKSQQRKISNLPYATPEELQAIRDKALNRKYSANTYMGLNGG